MMNVSIPPGLFSEPRVLEAEPRVILAWLWSFRHCVDRTNRQVSAGAWEPSRGVIARPKPGPQEVAVFGGHASFDEVRRAGLVVEHREAAGAWMPFGYPIEAEEAYVSRAGVAMKARIGKAARRGPGAASIKEPLIGSMTQTRQDKTRGLSKSEVGISEGPPLAALPDPTDDDAPYDHLTGEVFPASTIRTARTRGGR